MFWLIVFGISLVISSVLYWVSRPAARGEDGEVWWVIPRTADYLAVLRYMRLYFDVTPPAAIPIGGFTWVGPFGASERNKFPTNALWFVAIARR